MKIKGYYYFRRAIAYELLENGHFNNAGKSF